MSFEFSQATVVDDPARVSLIGSAMRKTGRPVVLVPLGADLHAGHISLIRAATLLPRSVVIVAWQSDQVPADFAREGVDVVWRVTPESLWPRGRRVSVTAQTMGLEPAEEIAEQLSWLVALLGVVRPSDIIVGDKDFELSLALRLAVAELFLGATVHGVPTVRTSEGVAMSLRNVAVAPAERERALALSAALTAGAHAAQQGGEAVLAVAGEVLAAAGVVPEYLSLCGLDGGPAPAEGDARLLVAATIGGVRLIDNAGVPVGVGFENLGE